jgi:hypothetical protein
VVFATCQSSPEIANGVKDGSERRGDRPIAAMGIVSDD